MNGLVKNTVKNDPLVRQGVIKNHLIQQIDDLKTDIKNLLDKKKTLKENQQILDCNKSKDEKMLQLKILSEKLKELNKQERLELKRQKDFNFISKTIDNIEYATAKKKKNPIAMDKAKHDLEMRNEAREKYIKFQNIEKTYLEYDSDVLPGNLFLHQDILKSYGLCQFIDIDEYISNVESISNQKKKEITTIIYNKRLEWLKTQIDGGQVYFELYDNLIKQNELDKMYKNKMEFENILQEFIKNKITDSQMVVYTNCVDFIREYTNCNIKTKRIKERYKIFVNNLSLLYSETSIEFHTYLSIKYNIQIVVNILDTFKSNKLNSKEKMLVVEEFDSYVEKYKNELQMISKKELFNKNTLKNLNVDLYSFLTDRDVFLKNINNLNLIKSNSVLQNGKYFKRWTVLSLDEKMERFKSFSEFYIDKYLVNTLIIDKNDREKMINILYDLLKVNYDNKKMVYRDYYWNTQRGIIESIKILKYDKNDGFELVFTKKTPSKDAQLKKEALLLESNITQDTISGQHSIEENVKISKKKVSSRTIITKDSEKIINEELLHFILKRIQNGTDEINKEDKEEFSEKIKIRLKIKKLMLNDKTKIYNKYDEIFEVIKNNK